MPSSDPQATPRKATRAATYAVAMQGFSDFERASLATVFRLAAQRTPAYEQAASVDVADFLIADADHPGALDAVLAAGRVADTVFVGATAPDGAMAWLARPIDPMHILRELDFMVQARASGQGWERPDGDLPSAPMSLHGFDLSLSGAVSGLAPYSLRGSAHGTGGAGRHVLVVEDSAIARKFMQRRLEGLGYQVHLATTAEEALALNDMHQYVVIFLDIGLGGDAHLDGLQACQMIRQRAARRAPPVVLMTGSSSAADRVRGSLAGCSAYLTKPLGEAEFMHALRDVDPDFEPVAANADH